MTRDEVKSIFDDRVGGAASSNLVLISSRAFRVLLSTARPSCSILYEACWSAGYTVNGVKP